MFTSPAQMSADNTLPTTITDALGVSYTYDSVKKVWKPSDIAVGIDSVDGFDQATIANATDNSFLKYNSTKTAFEAYDLDTIISEKGLPSIDDTVASTTDVWSSSKVSTELAALPTIDDVNVSTTDVWSSSKVSTELAALPTIDDVNVSTTDVWSSDKINTELTTNIGNYVLDDASIVTDKTWSSNKIKTELDAVVAGAAATDFTVMDALPTADLTYFQKAVYSIADSALFIGVSNSTSPSVDDDVFWVQL